jgi:hypothetical protein
MHSNHVSPEGWCGPTSFIQISGCCHDMRQALMRSVSGSTCRATRWCGQCAGSSQGICVIVRAYYITHERRERPREFTRLSSQLSCVWRLEVDRRKSSHATGSCGSCPRFCPTCFHHPRAAANLPSVGQAFERTRHCTAYARHETRRDTPNDSRFGGARRQ